MRVKTLLLLVLVLPAAILAGLYLRELYLVDACIDSGGSFDYITMTCDLSAPHPYIPFVVRHRALTILVSICACLALLVAWAGRSRSSGGTRRPRG